MHIWWIPLRGNQFPILEVLLCTVVTECLIWPELGEKFKQMQSNYIVMLANFLEVRLGYPQGRCRKALVARYLLAEHITATKLCGRFLLKNTYRFFNRSDSCKLSIIIGRQAWNPPAHSGWNNVSRNRKVMYKLSKCPVRHWVFCCSTFVHRRTTAAKSRYQISVGIITF